MQSKPQPHSAAKRIGVGLFAGLLVLPMLWEAIVPDKEVGRGWFHLATLVAIALWAFLSWKASRSLLAGRRHNLASIFTFVYLAIGITQQPWMPGNFRDAGFSEGNLLAMCVAGVYGVGYFIYREISRRRGQGNPVEV